MSRSQEENSETIAKFHERVEAQIALGRSPQKAMSIVCRRYPGLHQAFVEAVNANRGPHVERAIRRRFRGEKGGAS